MGEVGQSLSIMLHISHYLAQVFESRVGLRSLPLVWTELHLKCLHYTTLQRLVQHLYVSTPLGPEPNLDISRLQELVLLLGMSIPQGPELYPDIS